MFVLHANCCYKTAKKLKKKIKKFIKQKIYSKLQLIYWGTAVAQWLSCCATNRRVAGVSGFFIDIKSFRSNYGPGVDSASNRNEYEDYFLGVKVAGA